jgi:epoxide hydrolase-like predicted phosphatase
MTNGIKTVIWDMGGVILRTEDLKPRERLAKEYGLTLDGIHNLVFSNESGKKATLGEFDESVHWKNLGDGLGISGDELDRFQDCFWEGDRLDTDLVNFIRSLKPRYTTALLSNAWTGARENLTSTNSCIDAFHISVFSCEIGLAKPDPEIYRYMLRLSSTEPDAAIFVDDAWENIQAANQLGIHGILFKDANQAVNEVKTLLESRQG